MSTMFGPQPDIGKLKNAIGGSAKIRDQRIPELLESSRGGSVEPLHAAFMEAGPELIAAWATPERFSDQLGLHSLEAFRQLLRATRANLVCMVLHKSHVVTLIIKASKGQRQAVLDLVKVDKLFLHDHCTAHVIRGAEASNDLKFMEQLARSMQYRYRLRVRSVQRLYFHLLFLLEQLGMPLPSLHELWRLLDPQGNEYKSLSSFERDIQRWRHEFNQTLGSIASELSTFPETIEIVS